MASTALSMQVGPHLVELAGVGLDARQVGVVLADDLDPLLRLVVEHHQRALEPLDDVDRLEGRAVHLGVGPHRVDELGDPAGGLAQLAEQPCPSTACRRPTRGRAAGRAPGEQVGGALAPRRRRRPRRPASRPASTGRRRRGPRASRTSSSSASAELPSAVRDRRAAASISRRSWSRAQELVGGDRALGEPAERVQQRVAGLVHRVDGADRGRGRVVELVGEAGRQGAEGDQRLALAHGRLDRPGGAEDAADQVHGQRQPVAPSAPRRSVGRHLQQPTELDAASRWPGRRRRRPRPGSRRPSGRARPSARPGSPRGRPCGTGRRRRRPAPTSASAGSPSWNSSVPGLDLDRPADGQQLGRAARR